MPGTRHFARMNYNVMRGLREIFAPQQTLGKLDWKSLLHAFDHGCAYCGDTSNASNRGIVPDHVVAATDWGELKVGNVVPSCQRCNDARGKRDWREFLRVRASEDAAVRIAKIELHLGRTEVLNPKDTWPVEYAEFEAIQADWHALLERAEQLRGKVAGKRAASQVSRQSNSPELRR